MFGIVRQISFRAELEVLAQLFFGVVQPLLVESRVLEEHSHAPADHAAFQMRVVPQVKAMAQVAKVGLDDLPQQDRLVPGDAMLIALLFSGTFSHEVGS
ncbi:hypothetical protein BKK80_34540 (plasmid) [Cupriavidus malaysiensis]|uniref:Uncharacterized protein n=1 Tax=Cupriavidus malaysiensis TaxID=367825 RepID=A0ABN4TX72_9BURK|nr:hypothetical protein BKK80_34540 [Cupriavidus malaysiensis]